MSLAAFPVASRKELQRAAEKGRFLKVRNEEGQGNHKQKKGLFLARSPSLMEQKGITIRQITSLLQTRKFYPLGRLKLQLVGVFSFGPVMWP